MAKRVRLSADNGSNWYTLPGNSAELVTEAGTIDDTIFGQNYKSSQAGMIGWKVSANGFYKGFSGYVAKVLKSGTPTAMTNEAMSLVSGKTYQVTATTKRCFDRATALTFVHNTNVTIDPANIESIDHLFGRVTFISSFTPTGSVTVSGKHLPLTQVAAANSFSLKQTAALIDQSDFETAQANSGHKVYNYGLKTVSLEVGGFYSSTNALRTLLVARSELVIEINPDGNSKSVARGFFKPANVGQSGNVGALEEEKITFELYVPDQADVVLPFKWLHASDTTLNQAVRIALNAWEAGTKIDVQYLPDGTTGIAGDCVVTDVSLTGGLEAMNDFKVDVQGSGATSPVT